MYTESLILRTVFRHLMLKKKRDPNADTSRCAVRRLHVLCYSLGICRAIAATREEKMLNPSTADLLAIYISLSYVCAVHLSTRDANDYKIRRDDPRVITKRMKAVTLVSLLNILLIVVYLSYTTGETLTSIFLQLGLVPGLFVTSKGYIWAFSAYFTDVVKHVSLAVLLYAGPLLDIVLHYVFIPSIGVKDMWKDFTNESFTIWGLRNYVFGPITEELFYTSMILSIYLQIGKSSEISVEYLIYRVPHLFGLAHVHHAYELYSVGLYSFSQILFNTATQMCYTWLFGAFTNNLFLKSGANLWSCIIIHSFCNYLGLPSGNTFSNEYSIVPRERQTSLGSLAATAWKYVYIPTLVISVLSFKDHFSELTAGSFGSLI